MFDLDNLRFENELAQRIHDMRGETGTTYRLPYGLINNSPARNEEHGERIAARQRLNGSK